MATLLFLPLSVAVYAIFQFTQLTTLFAHRAALTDILTTLDMSLATWILWRQCRFLLSVTHYNRAI